jgi:tetratricopeptide (TPR) repeat protein
MSQREGPPLGTVLTVLRTIRSWSTAGLADAEGVERGTIRDYESGRKELSRRKLQHLVATMGFPARMLDRAVSFVESTRLAGEWARGEQDVDAIEAQIEAIAAEVGWSITGTVRQLLRRLTAGGQALEARRQAPAQWARLRAYSREQRRVLVREAAEFKSWALCELLCAESESAAADSPGRALELAELALEIAGAAEVEERRWRRQGFAWGFVGNARRVGNDLLGAAQAFDESKRLWNAGEAGDEGFLDGSRLLDLEASLRRDQRRLPEALKLVEQAAAASQGGEAMGRLLLKKAKILEELGEYPAALSELRKAAQLLAAPSELRLGLVLRFNLADILCHLGRTAEAESMLPEVRVVAVRLGNDLDLVRLRWLEGRVAAGQGRFEEAAAAFRQVRDDFERRQLPYDQALVTLELAALLVGRGRTGEVKQLARRAAPVFLALEIHREAQRALAVFRQAAAEETLSVELARRLVAYFYRARHDDQLRFEVAA